MSEKLHNFDDDPTGLSEPFSTVTFGMRAAALAGIVFSVGAPLAMASGLFDNPDSIAAPSGITCCPPEV